MTAMNARLQNTDGARAGRKFWPGRMRQRLRHAGDKSTGTKNIYASMWDFRRQGGRSARRPGSGLFKTTDGGDHWTDSPRPTVKGCGKAIRKIVWP